MATNVSTTKRQDVAQGRSQAAAERERAFVQPPVDIIEDSRGITLLVDLPGVNAEGLGVHVEGDTLLIEGTSSLALPQGTKPVYAEQRSLMFRRRFSLSGDLCRRLGGRADWSGWFLRRLRLLDRFGSLRLLHVAAALKHQFVDRWRGSARMPPFTSHGEPVAIGQGGER